MHDALNAWLGLDKYDWMKKPVHQAESIPITGEFNEWEELDNLLIENITENPSSDTDIQAKTQEDKTNKRKKQESGEEPKKKKTKTASPKKR